MSNPLPPGLDQLGFGTSYRSRLSDMLEQVPMLSDLPRREVDVLAGYVNAYSVKPGTIIFREGGRDNFLCLLVEGALEVRKQQKEHEDRRLAVIRPGKSVGEMTFLDKQPHSASVVATAPSTLLLLTEQHYERLAEENPRLALKVLWRLAQGLSHRLRHTSGQLVDYL